MAIRSTSGLALAATAFLAACSPGQVIYMKEKVVEHNAPPASALVRNHFQAGIATGPADVLFVADKTESFKSGLLEFSKRYQHVANELLSNSVLHGVSWQQFAVSGAGAMPSVMLKPGVTPSDQFGLLFNGFGTQAPIFGTGIDSPPEKPLAPLAALASALSRDEFNQRGPVPLFIVFLLGWEPNDADLTGSLGAVAAALGTKRGLFQTEVIVGSHGAHGAFPGCDSFESAPRFVTALATVSWRSLTPVNLCDPDWEGIDTQLLNAIVDLKSRYVLSYPPYQPDTMTVTGPNRTFRYAQDFDFDPVKNELKFHNGVGILPGDYIEVTYRIAPEATPLPGNGPLGGKP